MNKESEKHVHALRELYRYGELLEAYDYLIRNKKEIEPVMYKKIHAAISKKLGVTFVE